MKQYNKTPTLPVIALLAAFLLVCLAGCENLNGTADEETCTVAFNPTGGSPTPDAQTVAKDGKAHKPADPVFAGHSFAGWHTEESLQNLWDFEAPVTGDMTLFAKWTGTELEEGEWELSFNSQGGSPVASVVVTDGETVSRPEDPQLDDHALEGWYKEAACETPWDFETDTVTANTTLYAKWTRTTFTVHFESDGGTPAPQNQRVTKGDTATQPVISKTGFILEGWFLSVEEGPAWNFAEDTVEEDIALYAKWTAAGENQAVATFDADGGAPVPPPQPVVKGGTASEPDAPVKAGHKFDGWYKEEARLNLWDFAADTVGADTIIYAKWTPVYAVTFDSRGGSAVDSVTVRHGSKLTRPANPSRGRDVFDGWHDSITNTPWNFDSAITRNITLHAVWTPVWSVAFDSQGGSPTPDTASALDGGKLTRPPDPSRGNNAFAGWHSDTAYTRPWDFDNNTVSANTTLYAKWTAVVRFDINGGETAPPDQTVTSGAVMPSPANPARTGWTFAGWHKEAAGTTLWNFNADIVNGDMTLYAKWEIVSVTKINNVPVDGLINETLDLSAAEAVPSNASVKTIAWTVRDPGTTNVNASSPFIPATAGTLILTATIHNGKLDASGNIVDYTEDFSVKIAAIRKVTGIVNVPTDGFRDVKVDLGGAMVLPANTTNKTIVWIVKTPGAGVSTISGSVFTPSATGTLELTATIVNGDEDEGGALRNYTQDFSITVVDVPPVTGGVGMEEDTTVKLYANAGATPLSAGTVTTVAKNTTYFVRIDSSYTNVVWHLNGRRSTATGNRLYLDTGKTGLVKVTVEAVKGGVTDTGTHTFSIVE